MKSLGQSGEDLAAVHIQSAGYTIIKRNWRCERGEIDLVARDGNMLVFIEVKTRRSAGCGSAAEAVDQRKQAKLRLLARHYLHTEKTGAAAYRFDVVAVDGSPAKITHIRDAF
jgi:putative endonuclease